MDSRFEGSSFKDSHACVQTILQTKWVRSETGLIVPVKESADATCAAAEHCRSARGSLRRSSPPAARR